MALTLKMEAVSYVPLKRWHTAKIQGVTTQKIIDIHVTVETSNLTSECEVVCVWRVATYCVRREVSEMTRTVSSYIRPVD
jgi:hypothetical protein